MTITAILVAAAPKLFSKSSLSGIKVKGYREFKVTYLHIRTFLIGVGAAYDNYVDPRPIV